MFSTRLTAWEKFILVLAAVIVLTGLLFFYSSVPLFENFVQEDGIVEWLTVLGLLMASFVCFRRFFSLLKSRSWWFLTVTFFLGLFLFFAAGEEISWGQRIFGIESSEYFRENNAQGETNLHNLVVNGVKINKLVFSLLLGIVLGIYLVLIPVLHAKNQAFRNFINRSGVPVPKLYHVLAIGLIAAITSIIPHGKNPELLESGAALVFFLIVRYPRNEEIFSR